MKNIVISAPNMFFPLHWSEYEQTNLCVFGEKEAELQPELSSELSRELKKATKGFLPLLLIGSGHCCNQAPPSTWDKTTSSSTVSYVDADLVTVQRRLSENMLASSSSSCSKN